MNLNIWELVKRRLSDIYERQGQPKRYLLGETGIVFWKWAGAYLPQVSLLFYGMNYCLIFNQVFHWGRGLTFRMGSFVIDWCYKGQFGYWAQKNRFRVYFFGYEKYI